MGAFDFCKSTDMDLVNLQDEVEAQSFLASCTKNIKAFATDNGPAAFIGGVANSDRSSWVWFETDSKINFTIPFAPGKPSSDPTKNCLGIVTSSGKFALTDTNCYQTYQQFVCQEVKATGKGLNPSAGIPTQPKTTAKIVAKVTTKATTKATAKAGR